jgi:hypothetical protein
MNGGARVGHYDVTRRIMLAGRFSPRPARTVAVRDQHPEGAPDGDALAAAPEERPRLRARWGEYDGEEKLASWAARRSRETAVVIFEPSDGLRHSAGGSLTERR